MTIKVLDKATARQLHSGQVIVDIEAIVKELLENSIDANATLIELVFINNGLESIQIKDNGDGIEEKDRACVAKRHYTSKISTFEDLQSIHSYGFRGEAIHSICTISDHVVLTTKTRKDPIAKQYDVDKEGTLSNEKPTNTISNSGTMITVYKPFYNLPVRRQLAQKNVHQHLKKIQELLIAYALAHTNIRFSSIQSTSTVGCNTSKNNAWIKPVTSNIEGSLTVIYGASLSNMLDRWIETESTLTVDLVIPKSNSDPSVIYKGGDRIFVYVNQRPINYVKSELKDLISTIRNRYRQYLGLSDTYSTKNPFIYLDIQLEPNEYDVNIEPNKTTVFFHNKQLVYSLVEKIIDKAYPSKASQLFSSLINKEMPVVIQHEPVNDKQSANDHLPAVGEIPSPPEDNNNDWSFSMDDSDLQLDELESDQEEPEKGVKPQWQIDHSNGTSHTNDGIIQELHMTSPASKTVAPAHSSSKPNQTRLSFVARPLSTHVQTRPETESVLKRPCLAVVQTKLPFVETEPASVPYQQELFQPSQRPAIHQPRTDNNRTPLVPQKRPASLNHQLTSASQRVKLTQPTTNTLNQTLTIDYTPRQPIRRYDHLNIHDYLANCSRNEHHHAAVLTKVPLGPLTLYTQSLFDEQEQRRMLIELGVYHTKDLFVYLRSKDIAFTCKKNLPRPVQIQLGENDPLCAPLLSLKGKQILVKDDMHGHMNMEYTDIIDDVCTKNGFRVRYRRSDHGLVIHFTAITDVIENYGPKDFRELLQLIKDQRIDRRPTKVEQYVKSLRQTQDLGNEDNNTQEGLINALKGLTWHPHADNDWELGYSKENEQVLACKFIGDRNHL